LEINRIYHGDSFVLDKEIPDNSVDLILEDMPYNQTSCKWDVKIDLEKYWESRKRIIKDNGAIVLTAREPFTSLLVVSNLISYKHKWVWNKKQSGSFLNVKFMPLQIEEDVLVFSIGMVKYFPQMRIGKLRIKGGAKKDNGIFIDLKGKYRTVNNKYYPTNILDFPNCSNKKNNIHPTQKPVALFEYLIKTYTNEGDLVFDGFSGSGTTAVACLNTKRNFICIEKEQEYFDKSMERIKIEQSKLSFQF